MSIYVHPILAEEWVVYIHEYNHMVHNSLYNFGSALSYNANLGDNNSLVITYHEISRRHVIYINDPKTPCQSKIREIDMNICIQDYIENKIGCQLPWHKNMVDLPKCNETEQYQAFLTSYEEIAGHSGFFIAKKTGCLPSCTINEFTVNIKDRKFKIGELAMFGGYFFYPAGRYIQRVYEYTYDLTSYIADVGGLVGLFLGYSILGFYDGLKNVWKNKKL